MGLIATNIAKTIAFEKRLPASKRVGLEYMLSTACPCMIIGKSEFPTAKPIMYVDNDKKDWINDALSMPIIIMILNMNKITGFTATELKSDEMAPLNSPNAAINKAVENLVNFRSQTVLK